MRQKYKGKEKIFVDYAGMKMPWIDPITEEIFVGCLGASQFIYTEATSTGVHSSSRFQ